MVRFLDSETLVENSRQMKCTRIFHPFLWLSQQNRIFFHPYKSRSFCAFDKIATRSSPRNFDVRWWSYRAPFIGKTIFDEGDWSFFMPQAKNEGRPRFLSIIYHQWNRYKYICVCVREWIHIIHTHDSHRVYEPLGQWINPWSLNAAESVLYSSTSLFIRWIIQYCFDSEFFISFFATRGKSSVY